MDDVCYELWVPDGCNVIPSRIGLPIDNTVLGYKRRIAWYKIAHGRGFYLYTKDDEE